MSKKEKWPKHMQGKFCGYELNEDGAIIVAQMHYQKMDQFMIEQESVDQLLRMVTQHCDAMLRIANEKKFDFWKAVQDDYNLDPEKQYTYDARTKTLREVPKPKEEESGG